MMPFNSDHEPPLLCSPFAKSTRAFIVAFNRNTANQLFCKQQELTKRAFVNSVAENILALRLIGLKKGGWRGSQLAARSCWVWA
jgi:hypothetical protein